MTQTMLIKGRSLLLALIAAAVLVALDPGLAVALAQAPGETKVTPSVTQGDLGKGVGLSPTGELRGDVKVEPPIDEPAPPPGPAPKAPPPAPAPKAAPPPAPAPKAEALPSSGGGSLSGLSWLALSGAIVLIVGSGLLVRRIARNPRN